MGGGTHPAKEYHTEYHHSLRQGVPHRDFCPGDGWLVGASLSSMGRVPPQPHSSPAPHSVKENHTLGPNSPVLAGMGCKHFPFPSPLFGLVQWKAGSRQVSGGVERRMGKGNLAVQELGHSVPSPVPRGPVLPGICGSTFWLPRPTGKVLFPSSSPH